MLETLIKELVDPAKPKLLSVHKRPDGVHTTTGA
jgi:hypothetical protein